jgi:hypothetical protein
MTPLVAWMCPTSHRSSVDGENEEHLALKEEKNEENNQVMGSWRRRRDEMGSRERQRD